MSALRACVIGAGSSGIVAAKLLKEHGVPFDCIEKGSGIGGNWRFRNDNGLSAAYASLHINTSKGRMAYSDFPMPESYPDYPHHSQILSYFEDYVDHFGIRPSIRFNTSVERIAPASAGGWNVALSGGETRTYDAVLVANGHHWNPRLPDFPGAFDGRARHSHAYESPDGLEDRDVLVVGIGNSGVDIACEASRVARRTFLSTRRSAHILPKYALGLPIDLFTTPLSSRFPLSWQGLGLELVLRLARGRQAPFGVPEPEHRLFQAHPTVSAELLNLVGHGRIQVKPDVSELRGEEVAFADGSFEAVDEIIYATGYRISCPFLSREIFDATSNSVRLYRNVVHPDRAGLYFLGLIQPLGAIMPLVEAQAEWVAKLLTGECRLPDRAVMERSIESDLRRMQGRYVTSKRHTIQVDFFPYLRQIRREIRKGRRQPRGSHPAAGAAEASS